MFDSRGSKDFISGSQWTGTLDDLAPETIARISRYVPRHRRFVFYQFALDAKTRMVESDFTTAILLAVVALEGVHAVLLKLALDRVLGVSSHDSPARAKLIEEKAERLLLDVGFSEMIEFTSTVFLKAEERPPLEDVTAAKRGITIRNEIMHALAKRGQYKLRNRTNREIVGAYKSVLKMYDHFLAIVEAMT